jgi:hypothetical protein
MSAQQVFDVRGYGAVGDGTADDRAAIQGAIDAAGDGAIVFFPAGTYLVAGGLVCDDRQAVHFVGTSGHVARVDVGSVLKFTGHSTSTRFSARSSVGLTFRGLTFLESDPEFDRHLFDFSHSSANSDGGDHSFAECTFFGSDAAASLLNFNQSITNDVRNCGFWGGQFGLLGRTSSYCDAGTVDNCSFNGQIVQALSAPGNGWTIRGCTFETLAGGGTSGIDCADHQVRGLVVEGCWFGDGGPGTCVRLSGEGAFVAGNYFGSGSVGVSCDASRTLEGTVIVGNRFSTTIGVDLGANYTRVANRGIVIAGNSMGGAQQPVTGGEGAVVWAALRNATAGDVWDGFVTSQFRAPVYALAGITTRLTSGQPTDGPDDGTLYIDTDATNPKIWVRTGGTWKSADLR